MTTHEITKVNVWRDLVLPQEKITLVFAGRLGLAEATVQRTYSGLKHDVLPGFQFSHTSVYCFMFYYIVGIFFFVVFFFLM